MTLYAAPLDDMRFAFYDLLGGDAVLARLPGGEALSRELIDAVLNEAARFNEQVLAPLNQKGDAEGCHFDRDTASVRTPQGFREAYAQYVDGGWAGLTAPETYGGQGLPHSIGALVKEMIDSANLAWGTYPLLSQGATDALLAHGEDWQREAFLKPIVEGRWTGTMCLTEPQAGSDLGLLKTRAEPGENGTYRITGTKIFITAGEHDFTENIVHLVLARLPNAPAGSRGISMFIVPKFKVDRDGAMGERNAAACGAIEHKMGLKGSATCVMNFDGAEGYLIGQPHKGLMAMFTMMNAARLAVGIQGLSLIERAYQNSLAYCRERLQMRALSGAVAPDKAADPIIVHPDVRRMLLTQRAFAEGGRALALYAALQSDIEERSEDADERARAGEVLGFLIPICKALLTEAAVECTYHALQTYGGHGYIAEHGIEQFARDARITTLYEGTTGIQALDLLGRKVMQLQGAGLKHVLGDIAAFCQQHAGDEALGTFVGPLAVHTKTWSDLTQELGKRAQDDPDEIGAAAVDYLFYSGYIVLAWLWARTVATLDASSLDAETRSEKRDTARFYFQRILPRTHTHLAAMQSGLAGLPVVR
ncbi:acyl-CoA dehydrogenase C-terminal domain-containing protein [Oleiagrimonas soli]|uniref:3-methylmercaptopropionyl-CoA dehydrogenase n=1 Tax=Oleiagrimonas soli TaxID=1543381 RepID=A0A099CSN1_9GAMM|nr:acyl-CoA dehydrogenase C-terminal domain-containing protein [Oleiagrimonas soli]KGI76988.1 acyl-CoA dehydrogenase [Oleiagrimonas soli]MBB6185504.1 hypothetical protein [Oleiagrimonas soli]